MFDFTFASEIDAFSVWFSPEEERPLSTSVISGQCTLDKLNDVGGLQVHEIDCVFERPDYEEQFSFTGVEAWQAFKMASLLTASNSDTWPIVSPHDVVFMKQEHAVVLSRTDHLPWVILEHSYHLLVPEDEGVDSLVGIECVGFLIVRPILNVS